MPRVSIGLPVYNGETFIAGAVESLLAQTLTDFELLIVDNASTDTTGEICSGFAARDRRVRYHRNQENIGLAGNWNAAFDLTTPAPYFKWAAHDDLHAPTFLERCVDALDRDPGVMVAFPRTEFIDNEGHKIEMPRPTLPLDSPDPAVRFDALMPSDRLFIFGVMRRDALIAHGTPVIGSFVDHDGVLLLRLALRGRFVEIPEVLFSNRRHATQAQSRFGADLAAWSSWLDPARHGRRVFPAWRKHAELWKEVFRAPLSPRDRVRCALTLARWGRWQRQKLFHEVAFHAKDMLRSHRERRKSEDASH